MDSPVVPARRRRDKPQLSCSFCRQKKLRCDRERPCQACTARGAGALCTYPARATPQPCASSSNAQSSIARRLDSLENSLNSFIQTVGNSTLQHVQGPQDSASSSMAPTSPALASSTTGSMHCGPKGTVYVSSAHWISIMDGISELRHCIERDEELGVSPEQKHEVPSTAPETDSAPIHLLSGPKATATTKAELLRAVPDRSIVDRHVFWYCNRLPPAFTHIPSFLRQYENFWKSPSSVPILWLSILFSVMCLTPLGQLASFPLAKGTVYQPPYVPQVIQCLVLGDYSRGGPFAIEALLHYFVLEQSKRRDADTRNWSLYGLIVRLALREGYHREPSLFPNITPYAGELRRRLWMMVYSVDVVISTQMGLPRLIKDEQCDTGFPLNLLDSDFDEDTTVLIPRPITEITPVQSWIAKYKLMILIAQIADMSLITAGGEDSSSREKVKQIDLQLRTTYGQLPPSMKFTSLSSCLGSTPEAIMSRLSVSLLFQKGLIMLHRGHVVRRGPCQKNRPASPPHKRSPSCDPDSARTCIDAALQMLQYQDIFFYESLEGGALCSMGWRLRSSFISHEFLMAISVLCSYMYRVYSGDVDVPRLSTERIQALESALLRTYEIWQSETNRSKDAQRATETLGMLIGKLHGSGSRSGGAQGMDILDTQLESQPGDIGALLQDGFGLYGEGLNDFSSFIAW
ncbi:hypothetical protein BJY01DRAFT_34146 [Aspergillus pseudoustus]|uniref:Zn(2)-C6 fungal-type domain-containing protein n=1 Tax=Aspergillus pseudoustus TaxID=1810923 RepID=A0ABR4JEV4_9EURO